MIQKNHEALVLSIHSREEIAPAIHFHELVALSREWRKRPGRKALPLEEEVFHPKQHQPVN